MAERRRGAGPRRSAGRRPDPARRAAYDVLHAVRVDGAYANLALPGILERHHLTGRDAGFATELASGAIRRRGTYEAVLATCVDRPLTKVQAKLLDVLVLGAHQLLGMRVPDHAAISATVDLARDRAGQGAAGFANAVLRRVAAHDLEGWVRRVAPTDEVGFASVAHSHPAWVVEALSQALDAAGRGDDLDALLAADNAPPKVTLVARPGVCDLAELVAAGGEPTGRSPYAVTLPGGDPRGVAAVRDGRAGIQDEGSQLVALALADHPISGPDRTWLDLCAGPGGKTALLAAVAGQRGARVLANERQPHRAALVRRSVRAVGVGMLGVVTGDGTRPAWPAGSMDRVLVDAPCTGLGALRRRPEARWRKSPDDVEQLAPLQRGLLEAALDAVRPGGVVGYVTCSPLVAETTDVVASVLSGRTDAELVSSRQLWPQVDGTDAMFLALLTRR